MLLFSQIVTWLYDRYLFPCELTDAPDRATLKRTLNIPKFTKLNIKHNLKKSMAKNYVLFFPSKFIYFQSI